MDLLSAMFQNKPEELYALIWTQRDKVSKFFQKQEEAEQYIAKVKNNSSTYVGVGYHAKPQFDGSRGTRDDIVGLSGLYADVDIKPEKNFFKSFEEASDFLQSLPLPPTIIIHSGGGLQPWWLFKEAFVFESEQDRSLAERYTKGWENYLKERSGKDLDTVSDLPRILRIPGTLNFKYDPVRKVEIFTATGQFYNPSDFSEWLLPEPKIKSAPITMENFAENLGKAAKALEQISPIRCEDYKAWVEVGMALYCLGDMGLLLWKQWSQKSPKYKEGECDKKWPSFAKDRDITINLGSLFYWADKDTAKDEPTEIIIDPELSINADTLEDLKKESLKFRKTWDYQRQDLDCQSKYDYSLVGFGLSFGLGDQQIANLIIHHRRKHGKNPNEACEPGYIQKIINRLKKENRVNDARAREIEDARNKLTDETILSDKDKAREAISQLLGIKIVRLARLKADPDPLFTLYLENNRAIFLGDASIINSFTKFRNKLAGLICDNLDIQLKKNWECQYSRDLIRIAETVSIGDEATDRGCAKVWLTCYLDDNAGELGPNDLNNPTAPFRYDEEHICVDSIHFRNWVSRKFSVTIKAFEMNRILEDAGCRPYIIHKNKIKNNSKKETTRNGWLVADKFLGYRDIE